MSQFRSMVPRFFHTMSRMGKPIFHPRPGNWQRLTSPWACRRGYFRRHRNLPIQQQSFFDDLWHRGPFGRMFEDNFRNMQRLMDEGSRMNPWRGPRMWGEPCPWEYARPRTAVGREVEVKFNDQVFEVKVDVGEYKPEDLNVKIAGDKLSISGKFEAKPDEHGFVSREFTREFLIPQEVEAESIESMLTDEGFLVVNGKVKGTENIKERTINIEKQPLKEDPPDKN